MGAIITIMASLTGFFTQQIVLFQDCLELKDGASVSIAKTNNYTRSGTSFVNMNPTDFDPMIAAVNVGLIQPVVDFTNVLSVGCSSGNCTFPSTNHGSFSSLGVGHVCEDMTTHIRVLNETIDSNSNTTVPEFFAIDYDDNNTMEFPRIDGGVVLRTWTGPMTNTTISTIYMVFRKAYTVFDYKALNCSLFPTVNTYTANIESTILKEFLIHSVPLVSLPEQFSTGFSNDVEYNTLMSWWFSQMVTERTFRDGIEESCVGSENPGPGLVKSMKSIGDPTTANTSDPASVDATWKWWYFPEDCVWSMHSFSVKGMAATFQEIFDKKELQMGLRGGVEGPAQLRRLFKGANITLDTINKQMEDLTTAMTSVIRTNGVEGPSGYLKGEVWSNTTCVDIRWHWISFPATMIGLTGLFLLLVVVANRGVESDRLWKSSFLAVLFCEVELPGNRPVGKEDMAATAKSTSVCLEGKGGTLRLVGQ
jgi:hypothetical protein